jgi:hypothetical protein
VCRADLLDVRSRLAVLLLALVVAGCGGSENPRESASNTGATTETAPRPDPQRTRVDEILARLPPFDEPVSEEVDAYRRAMLQGFLGRCATSAGGAEKASFVAANTAVLDGLPAYPRSTRVSEYSIGHKDFNGCPEGLGPYTSYTTYRTYRLGGVHAKKVIDFYRPHLSDWTESSYTVCEQTFTRGEAYVAISACSDHIQLVARALPRVEIPAPPPLPPRPTGEQYPATPDDPATPDAEPTVYTVEPGSTCERSEARGPGGAVPTILPPPPGITARIEDVPSKPGWYPQSIVVEWSLGTVHGDCPPSELILSYPAVTAYTVHEAVHASSGTARMPLLDFVPRPKKLTAATVSVDGTRSRRVAVLIR